MTCNFFLSTCFFLKYLPSGNITVCVSFLLVGLLGYTARAREWDVEEANEADKESEGE